MRKKLLRLVIIFITLTTFFKPAFADITGKIAGRVIDAQKKEPIYGVNVMVEGSKLGAASNIDGNYLINNIPPGIYTLTFSAVGYQKKQVTGVKVSIDFTTRINVELTETAVEMGAIVVEAQTPLVRADLTSSHTTIDISQIESLPVESINQVLALQAGVIQGLGGEIHIRGGRSNEINYAVNGVSISNPFDNSPMVQIATNAVQELSVVSGTFNAEYGNALSGIVNTITREGGMKYSGHLSYYTGDYVSNRTDRFYNINDVNPVNNQVAEATFSGPIPLTGDKLSFFFSGRFDDRKGWLFGIREHNTSDSVYINPNNPNDIRIASTGDGALVPMNPSRNYSTTGKITFKPTSNIKINFDMLYSNSNSKGYTHSFKYNPDANYNYFEWGWVNSLDFRHAINNSTFYSLKAAYNVNDYKSYLYALQDENGNEVNVYPGIDLTGLKPSPLYQPTEKLRTPTSYSFYYGGTRMGHNYERAKKYSIKFDLNSQLSLNHELKVGTEVNYHELNYLSFVVLRDTSRYLTPTIPPSTSLDFNTYKRLPIIISGYIQDKMEYENFILNIGLRYDYFNAKAKYATNILYPSDKDPLIPTSVDKNSLFADAEAKHQISPRIGISFPITDKGIIHLSYGHFFQMPSFSSLYTNPEFKYSVGGGNQLYGNANLEPEKTVTYEIGLQQQLLDDLAFNVTGFFKDVRGLLASETIRVSGDKTYVKYVNKDYGIIKGLTFSLTKRKSKADRLGLTVDYTYQVSEGNDVNSDAFFLDLSSGRQSERVPIYLSWDQTHTLNTTLSYTLLDALNISIIGRLGTGLPYTPEIYERQILIKTNSERRPFYANVDFLGEYDFKILNYTLSIFLKVFNLFDLLIDRYVYNDTGRSTYTLLETSGYTKSVDELALRVPGAKTASDYFNNPANFYPPREIRLGLSIDF